MPQVLRRVDGGAADALEDLQGTYENEPGFLGVVHDGVKPVVVVDAGRLAEWRARVAPRGIAIAPSCVDTRLLAAVLAALPRIDTPENRAISAGYDVLDDAITVRGVERDDLIAALDEVLPDSETTVVEAIAAGTLRIDPRPTHVR